MEAAALTTKEVAQDRGTAPSQSVLVRGMEISSSAFPNVATRCPATKSSGISPGGGASRSTGPTAPTSWRWPTTPSGGSKWSGAPGETGSFSVEIEVEAVDRVNLLTNIMSDCLRRPDQHRVGQRPDDEKQDGHHQSGRRHPRPGSHGKRDEPDQAGERRRRRHSGHPYARERASTGGRCVPLYKE